jgi:hypothetical protein
MIWFKALFINLKDFKALLIGEVSKISILKY